MDGIDRGQMTAREVMERQQEKLQQLGPVVERLQFEFLSLALMRVYNILDRAGIFPPIPDNVAARIADAENLLYRYKDIMDPKVYSEYNNKLTDIQMDNALYKGVAGMVDMCKGSDGYVNMVELNKMIEANFGPENTNASPILPYELPISAGDNPDIQDLTPNLRNALGMVRGIINQLGYADTAEITSGYRDKDRNAAVGGAQNSYHTTGNAIDIYLGKNISTNEQERIKKRLHSILEKYYIMMLVADCIYI